MIDDQTTWRFQVVPLVMQKKFRASRANDNLLERSPVGHGRAGNINEDVFLMRGNVPGAVAGRLGIGEVTHEQPKRVRFVRLDEEGIVDAVRKVEQELVTDRIRRDAEEREIAGRVTIAAEETEPRTRHVLVVDGFADEIDLGIAGKLGSTERGVDAIGVAFRVAHLNVEHFEMRSEIVADLRQRDQANDERRQHLPQPTARHAARQ